MPDSATVLRKLLAVESLWLDSTAAGLRLEPGSADPKAVASLARREEKILAAWDGQCFHYPVFQFQSRGPCPRVAELVEVLPREKDGALGLDAVLWMFTPDYAFDGKSPAELFAKQPTRIIEEARIRRDGSTLRD